MTSDVEVIDEAATAAAALDPIRRRLLGEMAGPVSAATLAGRAGITRQKVNDHLRTLETHGLVRQVDQRRGGGVVDAAPLPSRCGRRSPPARGSAPGSA